MAEAAMLIAITREVSPSIVNCELTHLKREPIDVELAKRQHVAYEACLADLGCEVRRLDVEPDLPDSVFVEDTAIVLNEIALILRSGAASRRPEAALLAQALVRHRELRFMQAPGTLDGGDVLCLGRRLYIGTSSRSNTAGIDQVKSIVAPLGYRVVAVEVRGCLHLKSAVTQVGERLLLANRDWLDTEAFEGMDTVEVAAAEPSAANALLLGETVIHPKAHPQTRERLEQRGVRVRPVDVSEFAKAEGGVTCCSLIFRK
jgi:dimethylargininase